MNKIKWDRILKRWLGQQGKTNKLSDLYSFDLNTICVTLAVHKRMYSYSLMPEDFIQHASFAQALLCLRFYLTFTLQSI